MPKMDAAIYATHMDNVLKLARRKGGVSKPQLIEELNVTRSIATGLIERAGLQEDEALRAGRTQFFVEGDTPPAPVATPPEVKRSVTPPEVKAVAVPVSGDTGTVEPVDTLADLDAQIMDTRNTLREAAAKSGKALGEWATHQALVDALRARLTELVSSRLHASS